VIKHAIILAGGEGSRLRPYTLVLPKPLMPIGDYAILELIILQLKRFKFNRITLAVGYKANLIKSFFGNGEKHGIKIDYVYEKKKLGTMGPLHLVKDLRDDFIVMNGDILTDINYLKFLKKHIKNRNLFTIAAYNRNQKIDYGVLNVKNNHVLNFSEKPKYKFKVSMGIYALNSKILKFIPKNKFYGFDNLVLNLLKLKKKINVHNHNRIWFDIGRQDDYFQANDNFNKLKKSLIK